MVRLKRTTHSSFNSARRIAFIRAIFFIFCFGIFARLFFLQVLKTGDFSARASEQYAMRQALEPARGIIYIHERTTNPDEEALFPIVRNIPKYLVYAVPTEIPDHVQAAQTLAPIIGKTVEELTVKLGKKLDPYEPLVHAADRATWELIQEKGVEGISAKIEYVREYADGATFGTVSGFVQGFGQERRGQYGIEQEYDEKLDGVWGMLDEEFDADGNPIPTGSSVRQDAVPGSDVILTLDHSIQYQACELLEAAVTRHRARGGAVVVMEPATGAIRALCSSPRFNPNEYSTVQDLRAFENQAVMRAYEPGSIFKAITMAAALDTGAVTPDTTFEDTGSAKVGVETIKNADNKVYGKQTMTQVLSHSINTGAIYAQQVAGREAFTRIVEQFGFGSKTGIEFPTEASGNISALAHKGDIYTATASFGQGITATPLQMTAAFAAIANGGELMKPYLIQEIRNSDGSRERTSPHTVRRVISPSTATLLKAMLVTVVEEGHGKRAGVKGYWVAGKTGTAQVAVPGTRGYDPHKTIGSFVGFAPLDHPRFVMLVKVDEPATVTFAESSAAPLFGELADYLLRYYRIKPERETVEK